VGGEAEVGGAVAAAAAAFWLATQRAKFALILSSGISRAVTSALACQSTTDFEGRLGCLMVLLANLTSRSLKDFARIS
jgi:phosphohistidine phosphatase SixA